MNKLLTVFFTSLIGALCSISAVQGATIETVVVGNTGNGSTTLSGSGGGSVGAVDYQYEMGKYEVTSGQYADFLNAVGSTDTHGLYNTLMSTYNGISRSGSSGSYTYSASETYADRPVSLVSWGDAARFANWMHNGQPTGAQNASTTEGGSYSLNGATSDAALAAITRNTGATWVLPSNSEWVKAGYHQNNGDTSDYYDYATGTDTTPGQADDLPGFSTTTPVTDPGNTAHYGYFGTSGPRYTEVGEFDNSASPYETLDQNGNVAEWTEGLSELQRVQLGGAYNSGAAALGLVTAVYDPTREALTQGFRLALIPEPSTVGLFVIGAGLMIARRRQRVA